MGSKFWRIPGLNLECIRVADSEHSFPRHYHDTYVLEVVEQGVNEFWCDGLILTAHPHDIIVIHPGEMHTGYPSGLPKLSYRSLYPSRLFMEELYKQVTGDADSPRFPNIIRDPALGISFLRMHSDLERMHEERVTHSSIMFVIRELIAKYSLQPNDGMQRFANSKPEMKMKPALDFVSEKFNETVSLSELSTLCGFSEFHFVREFKRMVGSAPYEYVVARRIEESKKLLSGGMTIAEAAARTGFYDQSHFNRHFKRIVGITPGLYRRAAV